MKTDPIINVETCCYGFLHRESTLTTGAGWRAHCQRPFRGSWLWLWGGADAELTSLEIGGNEQLEIQPLAFPLMAREIRPEAFLALVQHAPSAFVELLGAPCRKELAAGLGAPSLQLPPANVGAVLSFRFRGAVQGVVLVGEQAP